MTPWSYEPAADLDQSVVERLKRFPREPDMLVYGVRSFAALVLRGWLRIYHGLHIIGTENLPATGSFIMVANHASHLDTLCLLAALPLRKLHRAFPAAARDYFFVSVPRLAAATVIVNALPFTRQNQIRQSLALCRQLLANPGNILILFPEGTRTVTGQLGDFKAGVGLLLAGTTFPVLPCYLKGAFEAWPKGTFFPRPGAIQLRIGAPRTYFGYRHEKDAIEHIARDLRQAVAALAA